jgi:hypothetical protein
MYVIAFLATVVVIALLDLLVEQMNNGWWEAIENFVIRIFKRK